MIGRPLSIYILLVFISMVACLKHINPSPDEATVFSLVYGYPLVSYATFALRTLTRLNSTNSFYHLRELTTPETTAVVRPNVDTLYSAAILDLSHHDLILDVPVVDERFWVFPFYDVYGNNYANLGTVSNSSAGKYLLRYSPSSKEPAGVQLCDETQSEVYGGCRGLRGWINSPTPYGAILARLVLKNNGTDVDKIHAIQDQIQIATIPRKRAQNIPPLTVPMLNSSLSSDPATRVMQMTARFAPHNPPRNHSDLARVNRNLNAAGIQDGVYRPQVRNLTAAAATAAATISKAFTFPANHIDLENKWQSVSDTAQGDYNTNYEMRAFVTGWAYLIVDATVALYPMYDPTAGSSVHELGANQAYVFTFNRKPPLAKNGFWSLTLYNADTFLIENPLDQYSLGDRSNLTYSDGIPVYGGDDRDEPFQILIQPADVEPPSNWTSNWLPGPPGGGQIDINLRFYGPDDGLQDGSWEYPVVKKQQAVSRTGAQK
ncbi:hypothetical protein ABOM_010559 [Aspergillus bombycis]|uniref:DUF1254 domain-containing protein n=1 Tax=Aspergillus bombycis TaxID=109264 RepID=A0A1F7ZNX3_9EURO|nr:hypothetical protein ABOM_010559 [Aspergillus bombycis]OGM40828.1 hypothetical protein ABOM_010559 [Aspergillus bombycis]